MIEIVSNRKGGEDTRKLATYAEIGVRYYVIYDPDRMLGADELRVYRLEGLSFQRLNEPIWFCDVGLGLSLWQGRYEDMDAMWLRWVDAAGTPVPMGRERAEAEQQRANAERERADAERERADAERERAEVEQQRADAERLRRKANGSAPSNWPRSFGSLVSSPRTVDSRVGRVERVPPLSDDSWWAHRP